MNETQELARFILAVRYEDLPGEVLEKAKGLVLDQLGVQLASSTQPWSGGIYRYISALGGKPESTIVNFGDKVTAENAAFANGAFGHGFEMDDTHHALLIHPGPVTVSTALAMGERESASGKDFLLSLVLGCEVMGRIGRAVQPSLTRRGHHATSSLGTFGAAVIAGRMLGFDDKQMINALSIAGSHSAGLRGYTKGGGSIKRVHPGLAAQGGIRSALLVRNGITGPPEVLEGENGFCQAFSDNPRPEEITASLGRPFIIMEVAYKLYACCIQIHSPLDALSRIMEQHPIEPDAVQEVFAGVSEFAFHAVGTIREPCDITGSQFSLPFSLALRLIKGSNSFEDYTEENLWDSEIRDMARRVRLEVDKEIDALLPAKIGAKVKIRLKDGSIYQEKVYEAGGTPANPATTEELETKFRKLAMAALPADRVDKIVEQINNLEKLADISTLARLLSRSS